MSKWTYCRKCGEEYELPFHRCKKIPSYGMLESMTNSLLFFLVLLVTLIVLVAFSMRTTVEKEHVPTRFNGFETKAELDSARYLHRYHGTDYSEDGIFYRDGVRHSLWDPRVRTDM